MTIVQDCVSVYIVIHFKRDHGIEIVVGVTSLDVFKKNSGVFVAAKADICDEESENLFNETSGRL